MGLFALFALAPASACFATDASNESMPSNSAALEEFARSLRTLCFMRPTDAESQRCLQDLDARTYPVPGSSTPKDDSWLTEQMASGLDPASVIENLPTGPIVWSEEQEMKVLDSIDALLGASLKDPYSVRAYALSKPYACRINAGYEAMCVCARYNGKNSHGAYVGSRIERYVFSNAGVRWEGGVSEESDARCADIPLHARDPMLIVAAAERTQ